MKHKFFAIIITLHFISIFSFGQDLIITTAGDSIKCCIYELKDNFVYFRYINANQQVASTLLKLNQVTQIKKGIYHTPANKELTRKKISSFEPVVHCGFSYGLSHYLGYSENMDASKSNFFNKLKKSKNFNFEGCVYIPNTTVGLGVFLNNFTTEYQTIFVYEEFLNGKKNIITTNNLVNITFTGPALFIKGAHKRTITNFMLAPGALNYNKINSSRLAFAISFSVEALPVRYIGVGLKSNYIFGNSEPFPYKSGGDNLRHVDVAALLFFYF